MAGGSPFEINNIFGLKVQRYKVALYVIGIYGSLIFGVTQYSKFKTPPPVKFESKQQEDFVKAYIKHVEHESHKPLLLRVPFTAPSS